MPELNKRVGRFQHHHARPDSVHADHAVCQQVIFLLHRLKTERVGLERYSFIYMINADGDVMTANEHNVSST
ncbi:hypothetical protein EYC82_14755 [Halieaceae bacterium IMCC11814]|uniref:RadC-like JAB domain-containing protein n=1 Tax=Candidatus Marimicrobium litorale TaxID=2518991 RepID=A0ABT3T8N9_9GAMM|nr:hypothetical protein [Candidatus Marimicrobium litorale]